jgi:D-alanyl-D-alanine-carboxypeptidase/D-alanyl-D-alanine-endopeptidase
MTTSHLAGWRRMLGRGRAGLLGLAVLAAPATAAKADPLLDEVVEFTGQVMFLETGVPGMIIAAVRGDDSAVFGFGETSKGSGVEPDGRSLVRLGSITKAFTGEVLAALAANGTVGFADPLSDHLDLGVSLPSVDARPIRLIDLATHSGGLPREVPHAPGPDDDPFRTITMQAFADWLESNPLLFKPGSAVLYSNFGFDLLAAGLAGAAGRPYPELLEEFVTGPLGMADTVFAPSAEQKQRVMQAYGFDGEPWPDVPTGQVIVGSGGLYSTADDLVRWLRWHLDRFSAEDAELRLLDHAVYLQRDGLSTVSGMDESGHMDAMGLGWVVMMPEGDRPLILQKAGGLQGFFNYLAFAPTRGVGAFVVINTFDFAAATAMAEFLNELIEVLAPR